MISLQVGRAPLFLSLADLLPLCFPALFARQASSASRVPLAEQRPLSGEFNFLREGPLEMFPVIRRGIPVTRQPARDGIARFEIGLRVRFRPRISYPLRHSLLAFALAYLRIASHRTNCYLSFRPAIHRAPSTWFNICTRRPRTTRASCVNQFVSPGKGPRRRYTAHRLNPRAEAGPERTGGPTRVAAGTGTRIEREPRDVSCLGAFLRRVSRRLASSTRPQSQATMRCLASRKTS